MFSTSSGDIPSQAQPPQWVSQLHPSASPTRAAILIRYLSVFLNVIRSVVDSYKCAVGAQEYAQEYYLLVLSSRLTTRPVNACSSLLSRLTPVVPASSLLFP